MRIQVLELPTVVVGDDVTTPFALVFDECADGERITMHGGGVLDTTPPPTDDKALAAFTQAVGASAFLRTAETVDLVDRYASVETGSDYAEEEQR